MGTITSSRGGGIYCEYRSFPTIKNNLIYKNTNVYYGGGILCRHSSPVITGNTISGNEAGASGGGIYCEDHSIPAITGNTIVSNQANHGCGIYCNTSSPTITNTILWHNQPEQIFIYSGYPVVTYSNIQGGWPGEGNINKVPRFIKPLKRDYRLQWKSPCIDTGNPDILDADGTRSDMGAFFFDQDDFLTLYVTPDTTEVARGGQLNVTYTVINRWDSPESCRLLSQVLLPGGSALNVLGPDQYIIPAHYTAQFSVTHHIPQATPTGMYEYRSQIGLPRGMLFDEDSFTFKVTE
jgi:parallel beta-helix repeat protein